MASWLVLTPKDGIAFVLLRKSVQLVYFIFDLLELDGSPLIQQPWSARHTVLEEIIKPQPAVQLCSYYDDSPPLLVASKVHHLEGVVAKRITSRYWSGKRSKDWLKLKF